MLAGVVSLAFGVAQNPATPISTDVNANRHPIDPNIYGVAYGDTTSLADLNAPLSLCNDGATAVAENSASGCGNERKQWPMHK